MQENMKILIGIPTNRQIQPQTVLSLANMIEKSKREHELMFLIASGGYTIAENRNYLCVQAIKNKCDYVMMIDDDMIFPPETLNSLIGADKDYVGVIAHSRTLPAMPVVTPFNIEEISLTDKLMGNIKFPDTLFKVKGVGGSVTLLKTSVLDKLEKPWYGFKSHDTGMTRVGEDYWFCEALTKAGIDIWVDPSLKIGHIGNYIY